jgi:hypothetical protein
MSEAEKPAPRAIPEIQKEYEQLCMQVGALSYEMEIKKAQLAQAHQKQNALNEEGAARKKLDDAEAANVSAV